MLSASKTAHSLDELVPVPLDLIPQDKTLLHPVYVQISGRAVLFRPQGDVLTSSRATALKERIDTLSIPRSSLVNVLSQAHAELDEERVSAEESVERLRHLLVAQGHLLEGGREYQKRALESMDELAGRLVATLTKNPKLARSLLRRYSDSAMYYINHSVNVAIYSLLIGMKYKLGPKELKTLAYGALVHNIGNIFLPREVLFKPGSLEFKEWKHIEKHPVLGAELLESFHVPREVVLMVLQHHERADGKGYPSGLRAPSIHLYSKICSIADVYDALTSPRPYREALSPAEAIQAMRGMKGKFDPHILNMME